MWIDRVKEFLDDLTYQQHAEWQGTAALKAEVAQFRADNPQNGLRRDLFNRIVSWKLRDQEHRTADKRAVLTDEMVREVTGTALRLRHESLETLSLVRIGVLQSLPGVGLGVASAILTLYFPDQHGIIDFRTWDEIHERDPVQTPIKRTFTINDYQTYLAAVRSVANDLHVDVQTVDFALWAIWGQRRNRA